MTNNFVLVAPTDFAPITLPASPECELGDPGSFLAGRRILIVEDEMLVMMDAEEMLTDLGCTCVFSASTIRRALALIEVEHFDAVLLDLNLGGDRSFAVADALAARQVPFVFATGYGAQGLRDQDIDRPVLMKPYSSGRLAAAMEDLLAV